MSTKPDPAMLAAYLFNELPPEKRAEVAALLNGDPALEAELKALSGVRNWLQTIPDPAAPPPVFLAPTRRQPLQVIGWAAAACWLLGLTLFAALRPPAPAAPAAVHTPAPVDTAWVRKAISEALALQVLETQSASAKITALQQQLARENREQALTQAAYSDYIAWELVRYMEQERQRDLALILEALQQFAAEQQDARLFDNQRFATLYAKLQSYELQTAFAP